MSIADPNIDPTRPDDLTWAIKGIPSTGDSNRLYKKRCHPHAAELRPDGRDCFKADLDKILYSESLRRLTYVAQVMPSGTGYDFHNRSDHSRKVMHIARSLASKVLNASTSENRETILRFGGLDLDVVSTAALIHDLGHPPFAHAGELELNELAQNIWGIESQRLSFEGNAQSLRVVTRLECHNKSKGLNSGIGLSNASIAASAKYPWSYSPGLPKYSAYKEDWDDRVSEAVNFGESNIGNRRSIEAEIIDLADDITYAIHDMEDFLRSGDITPDLLTNQDNIENVAKTMLAPGGAIEKYIRERITIFFGPIPAEDLDKYYLQIRDDKIENGKEYTSGLNLIAGHCQPSELTYRQIVATLQESFCGFAPCREIDGSSHSVASLRYFSSMLVGKLVNDVSAGGAFGVQISPKKRIIILALKKIVSDNVYSNSNHPLKTQENNNRKRVRSICVHYLDNLGLSLKSNGKGNSLCETKERTFVERIQKDGVFVPRFWPANFVRYLEQSERLVREAHESTNLERIVDSRYTLARCVLDAVASLPEDKAIEYSNELTK